VGRIGLEKEIGGPAVLKFNIGNKRLIGHLWQELMGY